MSLHEPAPARDQRDLIPKGKQAIVTLTGTVCYFVSCLWA